MNRSDGRPRRCRRAVALFALAFGVPSTLIGQARQVVGVAIDRDTGAPLPGVYVALVAEEGGEPLAAALSSQDGGFMVWGDDGATYRLRAERVGLASVTTEPFRLSAEAATHRIALAEQAVDLEGLTVQTTVRLCEIERREALTVQRWWDEVRKALQATALVHADDLEQLRFERFQREWTRDLRGLRAERYFAGDGATARPFLSQDAELLSEAGFVQGPVGERRFLAPDAAVLMSPVFLRDHCFALAPDGDGNDIGLAIEPLGSRDVPEIRGVLQVDTLTMALRSFDFEYVNLPDDIPSRTAAGGHLSFSYLSSGAWIVSEWWVRMPWVDSRVWPRTVLAYVDEGGRVTGVGSEAAGAGYLADGVTVQGIVYDSLVGRPLDDARVSVVGSRVSTRTDQDGRFTLSDVPPGESSITVHHADLARLGLPSPVLPVTANDGDSELLRITIPSFGTVAELLCGRPRDEVRSILTGTVFEIEDGSPATSTAILARWLAPPNAEGEPRASLYVEGTSGSDGRYVLCDLPPGSPVTLAVGSDTGWLHAGTAMLPDHGVLARDLHPTDRTLDAIVRGYVSDARTRSALSAATVSLVDDDGEQVTSVVVDPSGQFRLVVPLRGDYRVLASAGGFSRLSSDLLSIAEGDVLDLRFEMTPEAGAISVGGTVFDSSTGLPLASAGVHILRDGRPVALAISDSSGRYALTVPDSGDYVLLGQMSGYFERESPLPPFTELDGHTSLDLVLQSEAIELDPLTVTVRNERVLRWLSLEMGLNPAQYFGFRILQGARLEEAKRRAEEKPTETLRWLFIPVWHGGPCVSVNVSPRSMAERHDGPRQGAFVPGVTLAETRSAEQAMEGPGTSECGSLYIDGRLVPNEQIEDIDMSTIAVVTTLPGEVRMFTYGFEWAFRDR